MPSSPDTGLLLGKVDYRESDWVVTLFTRQRGRVAALEVLKSTMRTRDYVMKGESEGRSLTDAMHDGQVDGMQTFDDEIEKMWNAKTISKETAMAYATNPTNLALRMTDEPEGAPEPDQDMMSMLE